MGHFRTKYMWRHLKAIYFAICEYGDLNLKILSIIILLVKIFVKSLLEASSNVDL